MVNIGKESFIIVMIISKRARKVRTLEKKSISFILFLFGAGEYGPQLNNRQAKSNQLL